MVKDRGANMSDLKVNNRRHILELLQKENLSRKDIAAKLQLTPAAVTILTNEMIREGWLIESGEKSSDASVGRKKIMLMINKNTKYVLGIHLEPGQYQIGIANLAFETIGHEVGVFEVTDIDVLMDKVMKACVNLLWKYEVLKSDLIGIGIGVVGAVDHGVSRHAYGLWDQSVPIREIIEAEFGIPVFVENNVRALAEAELQLIEHDHANMVFIKYGPGIGAAMMVNDNLYYGSHNLAGEIGHFVVDPGGAVCTCGKRGCLETIASIKSMKKSLGLKEAELREKYLAGDIEVVQAVNKGMDYLGLAIANMITLYDPRYVVLYSEFIEQLNLMDYLKKKVYVHYCKESSDISIELSGLSMEKTANKSVAGTAIALKHLFYQKGGIF